MIRKTNKLIEYFAKQPVLWDIFEFFFGTDKQKLKLYRSKVGNPKKILDFGCSSGNVTGAFLDLDYTGVDIDEKLITHAKNKWKKYPNIKFHSLDIIHPNVKLGKFDAILFAGTGHHLPDSLYLQVFNEFDEYLTNKGEIHYIDTIKAEKDKPLLARWLCQIDRGKYVRTKKRYLSLLKQLSKKYKLIEVVEEHMSNGPIPHPDYLYIKLRKKNPKK